MSQFLSLSRVTSRPGSPRDWPWKFEKITLNSIRPGNTKMLPEWLQSHPKVTQMTPKSDPRISKWDLWKCVFYQGKTLLLQFPGHPKPSKKQIKCSTDNVTTQNKQISRKYIKIGTHQGPQNLSKTCTAWERKAQRAQSGAATVHSFVLLSMSKSAKWFEMGFRYP